MIAYSDNDDFFSDYEPNIKDALQSALCDYPDAETVFIAEASKKTISHYLHKNAVDSLLDDLNEQAADDCGEASEDWLHGQQIERHMTAETKAEIMTANQRRIDSLHDGLKRLLEDWATERQEQPHFWHLAKVQEFSRDAAADRIGEEIIKAAQETPQGVS
jgi:hypothetical protein